jgi:carbon monoxide dehydrogenase subunit G
MEMKGEQLITLPQQETWLALNDPEILKACIPGCEAMDRESDTEYHIRMKLKIGPVNAKFNGKLLLSDLDPPHAYSLAFEGQGGVAGFGKGGARVQLEPADNGTRLTYTVKATVGGKIAQVGSRLIDGVAKKLADKFFKDFNKRVSAGTTETEKD